MLFAPDVGGGMGEWGPIDGGPSNYNETKRFSLRFQMLFLTLVLACANAAPAPKPRPHVVASSYVGSPYVSPYYSSYVYPSYSAYAGYSAYPYNNLAYAADYVDYYSVL